MRRSSEKIKYLGIFPVIPNAKGNVIITVIFRVCQVIVGRSKESQGQSCRFRSSSGGARLFIVQ
jgi:hypothetical protein